MPPTQVSTLLRRFLGLADQTEIPFSYRVTIKPQRQIWA